MDYEKKYKEALEWARKVMQGKVGFVLDEVLEKFPELKESEDEKIRKELIEQVVYIAPNNDEIDNECNVLPTYQKRIDKYRAWLEKQGEHKKFRDSIQVGDKVTRNEDGVLVNLSQLKRVAKKDEKQGEQKPLFKKGDTVIWDGEEFNILDVTKDSYNVGGYIIPIYRQNELSLKQKPANKVEPKFHKGDCLVNIEYGDVVRVLEVLEDNYRLDYGGDTIGTICTELVDSDYRLWDIAKDAKDGDVLVYCDEISIYKDIIKACTENDTKFGGFTYYCCYDGNLRLNSLYSLTSEDEENIHPATKEQRDTLMKAMADEGYIFDFEKKELKKIELKPIDEWYDFIRWFVKQRTNDYTLIPSDDDIHKWGDNILNHARKVFEQKSAWSEVDEEMLKTAITSCEQCGNEYADNWLKSLKERVQPMPKQGWSEEDERTVTELIGIFESAVDGGYVNIPYRLIKDYIRVLKSCLSQNAWKPSERKIQSVRDCALNKNIDADTRLVLDALYQDLKKLIKE